MINPFIHDRGPQPRGPLRRSLRRVSVTLAAYVVVACSGTDTTGVPAFQTSNPYTRLQLNVRGAVMSTVSPYDTLQLIATAYDASGHVMPLPGPVTYTASDTTLNITASGLLTIIGRPSTGAYVIARVQDTVYRVTRTDTAYISGTTTVPTAPLASFSIQPVSPDSAVLDLGNGTKTLPVTALDAAGNVISRASLKIHYASENTAVATVNATSGVVTAQAPGQVRLTASTTYYGVTKTDSVDFRIGYQDTLTLTMNATALANGTYNYSWTISNFVTGVGKTVIFAIPDMVFNSSNNLIYAGTNLPIGDRLVNEGLGVVFDDSSAAQESPLSTSLLSDQYTSNGSGNVSLQIPDSMVVVDSIVSTDGPVGQYSVKLTTYCTSTPFPCATARSFPTAGTYHFHSTTGAAGTITVVAP